VSKPRETSWGWGRVLPGRRAAAAAASPDALARRSPSRASGAARRPNREPIRWQVASGAGWVRGRCQRPCPAGSSPPLPPPPSRFLPLSVHQRQHLGRSLHTHTYIKWHCKTSYCAARLCYTYIGFRVLQVFFIPGINLLVEFVCKLKGRLSRFSRNQHFVSHLICHLCATHTRLLSALLS